MAASTVTSPIEEMDVTVLKETLRSQRQLLQKLNAELDVEREAASTATNEALSMILRLQGEKAAMKMEASQYKRLAEEKISHAEESLEIFDELMHQKEMEISAQEIQIEAYKYKLLSLGCEDLDDIDNKFSDNPFGERNDSSYGEKGIKIHIRRLGSLPSHLPTDFYKMRSSSIGENHATQMQEVSTSIDATNTDLVVHDVFEVPESNKKNNDEKNKGEEDNRLKKPDMIGSPEDDDDIDWYDFLSPDPDYKSPVEYDTEWTKMNGEQEKRSCKPNDDCKSALLRPSNRSKSYRSELQRLAQRVKQLEGKGKNRRRGISEGREDELDLFKQLREQLNSIQSEMRSLTPQKQSPADEVPLVPLTEVMLGIWF